MEAINEASMGEDSGEEGSFYEDQLWAVSQSRHEMQYALGEFQRQEALLYTLPPVEHEASSSDRGSATLKQAAQKQEDIPAKELEEIELAKQVSLDERRLAREVADVDIDKASNSEASSSARGSATLKQAVQTAARQAPQPTLQRFYPPGQFNSASSAANSAGVLSPRANCLPSYEWGNNADSSLHETWKQCWDCSYVMPPMCFMNGIVCDACGWSRTNGEHMHPLMQALRKP